MNVNLKRILDRRNLREVKHSLKQQRSSLLSQFLSQRYVSNNQPAIPKIQPESGKFQRTSSVMIQIDNEKSIQNDSGLQTGLKNSYRSDYQNFNEVLDEINPRRMINSLDCNRKLRKIDRAVANQRGFAKQIINKKMNNSALRSHTSIDCNSIHKKRSHSEPQKEVQIKSENRLQRIKRFSEQRLKLSSRSQQQPTQYKNEKLSILAESLVKVRNNIPDHLADTNKFKLDLESLIKDMNMMRKGESDISRNSQNYKSILGKLLYFVGYEINVRYSKGIDPQFQYQQVIISNYYQIYFSMRLKIPLMVLECYLVMIDFAMQKLKYSHAQKFAEKCLLASIYYRQKYYQQKSIQKISMCEYYKGNICEATYLHDNNGQVAQDSVRKIRDGYNQNQQLEIIFHHLYEVPRFDVWELIHNQQTNIKSLVVFRSPRSNIDDSMKQKRQQMKIDIFKMQRLREFKEQSEIMKKQIKRHENLFTVRKAQTAQLAEFKPVKRNLTINEQNQSSQILRAHQSLNRINVVNKQSIKNKLNIEFIQFCQKNLNKLR